MNRTLFITALVLLSLSSCTEKSGFGNGAPHRPGNLNNSQPRVIEIPVNKSAEIELQSAVDNGHQPWRLLPDHVACSELAGRFPGIDFEDCKVEKIDQKTAVVSTTKDGTSYRVYLERFVKPDGIWTATKIEIVKK